MVVEVSRKAVIPGTFENNEKIIQERLKTKNHLHQLQLRLPQLHASSFLLLCSSSQSEEDNKVNEMFT